MIGDKLIITDYHRAAAATVFEAVQRRLAPDSGGDCAAREALAVSIAGESGSGKTETAACLAEALQAVERRPLILSQDDYFRLPPKTNHQKRLTDISWVGPQEVRLDLLEAHIEAIKRRPGEPLTKPLVHFDEDRIGSETITPAGTEVVIVEGTYTTLLKNVDIRAFINQDYRQTKKARLARARDPAVDFLERVLEIEHQVISTHLARADVVIAPPSET